MHPDVLLRNRHPLAQPDKHIFIESMHIAEKISKYRKFPLECKDRISSGIPQLFGEVGGVVHFRTHVLSPRPLYVCGCVVVMNPYPVQFEPVRWGFAPPFHPPPPPFPNIRYPLPFFPGPTTYHPPFPGSFTPSWDDLGARGRSATWRGQRRGEAARRGYRQRVSLSKKLAHP